MKREVILRVLRAHLDNCIRGTTAATLWAVIAIFFFSSPGEGEKREDATMLSQPLADE